MRKEFLKPRCWVILCIVFLSLFGLTACKLPQAITNKISKLPPHVVERLAHIPYLGQYLVPQIAPKDLLQRAQIEIEKAVWSGAETYAPEFLDEARKDFQKGKQYFLEKKFLWSKHFLKKAIKKAETARLKSERIIQQKKEECYRKLEELKKELNAYENKTSVLTKYDLLLKLKELTLLIQEEKFEEFNKKYLLFLHIIEKDKYQEGGKAPHQDKT